MTSAQIVEEMNNAGGLVALGEITWEQYFDVLNKLTAKLAVCSATESAALLERCRAELEAGTCEVGR